MPMHTTTTMTVARKSKSNVAGRVLEPDDTAGFNPSYSCFASSYGHECKFSQESTTRLILRNLKAKGCSPCEFEPSSLTAYFEFEWAFSFPPSPSALPSTQYTYAYTHSLPHSLRLDPPLHAKNSSSFQEDREEGAGER